MGRMEKGDGRQMGGEGMGEGDDREAWGGGEQFKLTIQNKACIHMIYKVTHMLTF